VNAPPQGESYYLQFTGIGFLQPWETPKIFENAAPSSAAARDANVRTAVERYCLMSGIITLMAVV
jgi:hypothetical protein